MTKLFDSFLRKKYNLRALRALAGYLGEGGSAKLGG